VSSGLSQGKPYWSLELADPILLISLPAPTRLAARGSDGGETERILSGNVRGMARLARVVAVDIPLHVTQRGNARRFILDSDADRTVYLNLLWQNIELHSVSLIGYCLMSNHVHLAVIPHRDDRLALALKHTHGRYASYWNTCHGSSGHVWQGRYYSCPLDQSHLWEALRYAELNPVRAGLVSEAESWIWSSAGAHCGTVAADGCLAMEIWRGHWNVSNWREYLVAGETESEIAAIRQCTHTGRPLGTEEFIQTLEETTQRHLAPRKGGRPGKPVGDPSQCKLVFDL
jgi:putative transposase